MKLVAVLSLACLLAAAVAAEDSKAHPVASVINLLNKLEDKVEAEGEAEQATWLKFKKWCTDSYDTLAEAITSDKNSIDTLISSKSAKTRERDSLHEDIQHLTSEITKYTQEGIKAKRARNGANKLYEAADKDFASTIKAVTDGLTALKASKKASLLQFSKPENPQQEHALRDLIQQPLVLEQLSDDERDALSAAVFGPTDADILAKEKYAKSGKTYTFKSGGVIQLLTNLKTHFEDARTAATKAETAQANDYEVAKSARDDALGAAKKTKASKTKTWVQVKKDLATVTSYLKTENAELTDDTKTQHDTRMSCRIKEDEYNERNKVRTHEMAAMKAAEEVLAEVTGVRSKKPKTQKLPSKPKLFLLQVPDSDPKMEVVNLLREEGVQTHSKELEHFANQLSFKLDGPFDEANAMIQKMIFRLMSEQTAEDEHKHWCDKEISHSRTSQKDKSNKVKSLDKDIKKAKAESAELGLKIEELDKKAAKLLKFMNEATQVRKEGKQENKLALKDAQAAQAAIAKAQAVLEEFYKDSGMIQKESWEFLQVLQVPAKPGGKVVLPKNPASWTAGYTGATDPKNPSGGVIAVLTATAADFAKMEADTANQEHTDQAQFEKDMQAATIDKAQAVKESEMKSDEKKRKDDDVRSLEKKRNHVASEGGAVSQYLKDLEGSCIDGDSSYSDRKKARDREIGSLRTSQVTLQKAFGGSGSFLQKVRKHA